MTLKTNINELEKIAILDFGGQFNQVLARRIRELGVYSELLPHTISAEKLREQSVKGVILSGGPKSVNDRDAYSIDPRIFEMGVPILGIDYGMHLITKHFGGSVEKHTFQHLGNRSVSLSEEAGLLFNELTQNQSVWVSHTDQVTSLPKKFKVTASNDEYPVMAFENSEATIFGLQFHPEVSHTEQGTQLLENFVFNSCQASGNWSMTHFIEKEVATIRETVGDKKVLLALSGGVDSSVVGVLLNKAIGNQLTCIFVDHGLLRKDEGDQVMNSLFANSV